MPEPTYTDRQTDTTSPSRSPAERRRLARLGAAGLIGALVAVFAVVNLNDVKVHWVVATGRTPLIVVIVLAFLLGVVADRLVLALAKRRRRAAS